MRNSGQAETAAASQFTNKTMRRYSVVGTVARLNSSLAAMEAFLPAFFCGAVGLLDKLPVSRRNTNAHPSPSAAVQAELNTRLALDIEFYQFVQQRLELQLQTLGLQ